MVRQIGLHGSSLQFCSHVSSLLTSVSYKRNSAIMNARSQGENGAEHHSREFLTLKESETSRPASVTTISSMPKLPPPLVYPENLNESDLDLSSEFTSEGGKSTGDIEEAPSADLLKNLVVNLEYHFGDEALSRDLFLLKHIKRQPEGYVSLKLLAGYKKVKKLSRNWRVVSLAAQQSKLLEVNDSCTRVRRRSPLPPSLAAELPSSRSLVATGLPPNLCTIEALACRFAAHGSVAALQIIKPGKGSPPQLYAMRNQSDDNYNYETTCGIIEFEDVWGASKALQDQYEPPMSLQVMRSNRRKTTPERRTSRPCHHQIHKHIDESRKRGSGSISGSDGDESSRAFQAALRQQQTVAPLQQLHFNTRACSSMPNSPASRPRRYFIAHGIGSDKIRSPRGPDGSKGFSFIQKTSSRPS